LSDAIFHLYSFDLRVTKRQIVLSLLQSRVLGQLYERVLENLQHATPEIKRLALDALDIRVYASPEKIEIRGVIPLELALPTTARTSARIRILAKTKSEKCLFSWTYSYSKARCPQGLNPNEIILQPLKFVK